MRRNRLILSTIGCLFLPLALHAHAPSDTFLSFHLTATNLTGQWEIKLADLQHALGLDKVDPRELRLREEALALDTMSGLTVKLDGVVAPLKTTDEQTVTRRDGESLVLSFQSDNWAQRPSQFDLKAEILFALDPQMRCIVRLEYWAWPQQTILNLSHPILTIPLAAPPTHAEQLLVFLREGIWHIWTGYDHILFLISLLLSAVLTWHEGKWTGASAFRPVLINVLKIVTAFTIAHSITLALAALHVLELPTRWTESAIAASVIIAALNNLWPMVRERSWMVAFAFGLIHGFGFANALADAGLVKGGLAMALVGFNVGVEIGQLAIVAVVVPMAYRFRHTTGYNLFVLRGGSSVVIAIAAVWLAERLFDYKLLPF